ncbi:dephospho-CoA kinase [Apilactobacillus ozensis DSM 23829 = JCM 17196]|uniref:Dephospho-CoA kinase n=1 Tax=Apilactobacillus ozensis DSM 23829 = JCM 17196 TaxID=1423781 RepID=A0A0R2ANR7_9LACO|nr:dephospho-CoA kinase [Apilactobacillus ozensis]KRM68130.1 dephospho-CoA kinase [Apilactobacillus ozensis DSM 23829 = JCM 17196]
MTKIIGITGGIATGKSTVSSYLAELGYQIIDADKITHTVQSKGSKGLQAIIDFFGNDYLLSNGELNRKKLSRTVFSNKNKLKRLTRIVDPFIRKQISEEIRRAESQEINLLFLDAPTLFENGYQLFCDKIITVYCSPEEQLKRLTNRNKISISVAIKIIKNQWPIEYKESLSDFSINTDGLISDTRSKFLNILNKL